MPNMSFDPGNTLIGPQCTSRGVHYGQGNLGGTALLKCFYFAMRTPHLHIFDFVFVLCRLLFVCSSISCPEIMWIRGVTPCKRCSDVIFVRADRCQDIGGFSRVRHHAN